MSNDLKQNQLENNDTLNQEFRPSSLGEVIGQDSVIEVLLNSILYNEIPNSLILQGQKGTGKTSTAKAFTKTLNCKELPNTLKPFLDILAKNPKASIPLDELKAKIQPCNECDACKAYNIAPEYAGVIEIDAGSEGKIEEVRNIKEKVRYTGDCKYKVVIIDEAHNMSDGGKTALLKIIEEPPKNVLFIFATTHPDNLLPTIKSRSIMLKFNGVEDNLIKARLREICSKKDILVSEQALEYLSSTTDGGVRDAIKNLQHASLKCKRRTIEVTDLEDILDIEPEYIDVILNLMFDGNISDLLVSLKDTFSSRKISIENVHLDFFIAKLRKKMYAATDKAERAMLRDVYKVFVGEKERFMYNVTARVAIETAVLESFDLIEDFKMNQNSNVSNPTFVEVPMSPTENIDTIFYSEPTIDSDSLLIKKADIFTNVFKIMFDDESCNIMFNGTSIEYIEEKDSLCFYMPTDELVEKAKFILKTDLAQSIKGVAGFRGFMVKTKI